MPNARAALTAIVLLVWIVASVTSTALGRTWTDRTGKFKVEAELVTVKDGSVYLEIASGDVKKVPLEKLSVADLRHVASLPKFSEQVTPLLPAAPTAARPSGKQKMAVIRTHLESGSVRQFRSPSWGYDGLVFSNEGAYLLTLGNKNVTVFDIDAAKATGYEVDGEVASRECLALSPDGKRLLAGNRDGEVFIWRFDKGKLTPENHFAIYKDDVVSIAVSPDGQRAITTHDYEVACLWEMKTGKVLASYSDFYFGSCGAALFSQQGGQALISDGGLLALIDTSSTKLLQVMELSEYSSSAQSTVISNDRSRIAVCDGSDTNVWEIRSGKRLPEIPSDDIQWSAAFTTDGKHLVTGGSQVVSVWNVESGRLAHEFQMQESGYVKYVAVSPDGLHIAAIGAPIGTLVEVFRLPPALTD